MTTPLTPLQIAEQRAQHRFGNVKDSASIWMRRDEFVEAMETSINDDRRQATEVSVFGIDVSVWKSDHDGVDVVQIDTGTHEGRLRVNLNDAPVWDGDPAIDNYPGSHFVEQSPIALPLRDALIEALTRWQGWMHIGAIRNRVKYSTDLIVAELAAMERDGLVQGENTKFDTRLYRIPQSDPEPTPDPVVPAALAAMKLLTEQAEAVLEMATAAREQLAPVVNRERVPLCIPGVGIIDDPPASEEMLRAAFVSEPKTTKDSVPTGLRCDECKGRFDTLTVVENVELCDRCAAAHQAAEERAALVDAALVAHGTWADAALDRNPSSERSTIVTLIQSLYALGGLELDAEGHLKEKK